MQFGWGRLLGQGARRHSWLPNLRTKAYSWPFLAGAPDSRLDFKRRRQEFEACTQMETKWQGPELLLWTSLLLHLCTVEDQWRTRVPSQANSEHEGRSSDTVSSPLPSLSSGEAAKFYEGPPLSKQSGRNQVNRPPLLSNVFVYSTCLAGSPILNTRFMYFPGWYMFWSFIAHEMRKKINREANMRSFCFKGLI